MSYLFSPIDHIAGTGRYKVWRFTIILFLSWTGIAIANSLPQLPDLSLRPSTVTTYAGMGIYNLTGTGQTVSQVVAKTVKATYYVHLQNKGTVADTLKLSGTAAPAGWTVEYTNYNTGAVITSIVTGSGWSTALIKPGAVVTVAVYVTPGSTDNVGAVATQTLMVTSVADASKQDVGVINTTKPVNRPDLYVRPSTVTSYIGSGVYNLNGAKQTVGLTVGNGVKATYYVTVKNNGNIAESFTITGPAAPAGWTVTYNIGASAITGAMTSTGWRTPVLNPTATVVMTVYVIPGNSALGDTIATQTVTVTSNTDPTKQDAGVLNTTVPVLHRPDLYVRPATVTSYIGSGVYNLDGANQTVGLTVANGGKASYFATVKNNGNIPETFTITGLAAPAGWTVNYINGASIITGAMTATGWTTPVLNPMATVVMAIYVTPGPTVIIGSLATQMMTVTSSGDPRKQDVCGLHTTAALPTVLTLTGFTPLSGPKGQKVTLTGTNLTGATMVTFNGVKTESFTVVSATSITAIVPNAATTGKIAVMTPIGTVTSATNFMVTGVNSTPGMYYYVSNAGDDANEGTSEATPWKTIAKVNATTFSPSDRIYFKRGDMWRETLTVSSSGTEGSSIIFAAYGSGANPEINGSQQILNTDFSACNTASTMLGNEVTVFRTACSTDPIAVWEDGQALTESTIPLTGTYGRWYWDGSTYLYICASDGSNVLTNAKLYEKVSLWYTIDDNKQSWLEFQDINCSRAGHKLPGLAASTVVGVRIRGTHNLLHDMELYSNHGHAITLYEAKDCRVYHCKIHDSTLTAVVAVYGNQHANACMRNVIEHCEIYQKNDACHYSPIILHGKALDNIIQYNDIYLNISQQTSLITSYDSGTSNTIRYNYLHYKKGHILHAIWIKSGGVTGGAGPYYIYGNAIDMTGQIGLLSQNAVCFQDAAGNSEVYNNDIIATNASYALISISNTPNVLLHNNNLEGPFLLNVLAVAKTGFISDKNNFYATSNYHFAWGNTDYTTLPAWVAATGQDTNSTSVPFIMDGPGVLTGGE